MAQVTVSIEESNTPDLCRALLDRTLDIAVIRPPHRNRAAFRSLPDRGTDPDRAAQRSSALRARAAAAQRHRQRTAHHFPRSLGPGFHDKILSACQAAGFSPITGQEAPQIAAMVPMVAAGLGVAIVPGSLDQIHASGVSFHPIKGPAPVAELAVATRSASLHL
jgi:DNA-binding transcriptional LysR family regulator